MSDAHTLTDKLGDPVEVIDQPELHRAIIVYPSEQKVAGFTMYEDNGGERIFWHTVVPDELEGRGLATILVREAMDQVATTSQVVVPTCPFVEHFLDKHGEGYAWRKPTKDDINWLIANADGARELLS
ncbi:MAG: GNAT family N-acetyltransferase [Corynebacterium sp.]|nr:GNAT family N-acetyltransferase [Corynebacterium sp.]